MLNKELRINVQRPWAVACVAYTVELQGMTVSSLGHEFGDISDTHPRRSGLIEH